ncbi:Hypothetical predicted protein [Olea europaea subsp. europaea]|uniref:Uncharacterized protein n=1 Tax=Olea europaea subsp. europaea TaxID=158383 RepID=A0A8S0T0E2_OLEEU|nr:Hypothetical predicted protein [Olea europaea subsp. europaea]
MGYSGRASCQLTLQVLRPNNVTLFRRGKQSAAMGVGSARGCKCFGLKCELLFGEIQIGVENSRAASVMAENATFYLRKYKGTWSREFGLADVSGWLARSCSVSLGLVFGEQ